MSDALLQEVEAQGLHVFQYCDDKGSIIDNFPVNPNGSVKNIAAISNKRGNVMAMMPHPERTLNGDRIFQSMRDYIAEGRAEETVPLYYYPRRNEIKKYSQTVSGHECIIELIITDNHALTVQNTLHQVGIPVTVKRQIHWQIECDDHTFERIKRSGVLFNDRKEMEVAKDKIISTPGDVFLVRAKEDLIGAQKKQALQDHFSIQEVNNIHHSILWHFSCENGNMADLTDKILTTNIIFNPYAHECYFYNK